MSDLVLRVILFAFFSLVSVCWDGWMELFKAETLLLPTVGALVIFVLILFPVSVSPLRRARLRVGLDLVFYSFILFGFASLDGIVGKEEFSSVYGVATYLIGVLGVAMKIVADLKTYIKYKHKGD